MNTKLILSGIKAYVRTAFQKRYPRNFYYYNINHTELIVKAVRDLSDRSDLSKEERFLVEAAGWFFDIAQLEYWEDPDKATTVLNGLFADAGIPADLATSLIKLLPASYGTQPPLTVTEQILCDAIRFHWSKKSFNLWTEALRKDTQFMQGREIPLGEWLKQVLVFMQTYHEYIPHGKTAQRQRKINLELLEEQARVWEHHQKELHEHHHHDKHDDQDKPDKGIETMFRVAASNNQRLTALGDNKAHILITVNSIILSAIISILLRKLDDSSYLVYPTFLLLAVSLFSMVFAILATRPRIPGGRFSEEELDDLSANLLFFGNFYRMSLADYSRGMLQVIDNKKFVYNSLIKDVYGQGVVLGKKYLMLRIAYNIFMWGLILSVAIFFIVFFLHTPAGPATLQVKP